MPSVQMEIARLSALKAGGGHLSSEEIQWLITHFTAGTISDSEMTPFLKAVLTQGMNRQEIVDLTNAMIASGQRMDFRDLGKPTVDKHSTGGVGDKVTLALMPLVASYGVLVPQTAGRGLGITGGTLDKLESIPGFTPHLTPDQIRRQLQDVGGVVCAAGEQLAPADAKLYALRDVTGTVASMPLIASSVMSKKIAEGTQALVLDVKVGSGAFMPDVEQARILARTMCDLGEDAGLQVSALLTDMNTPLGKTIGNANEVREALEVLAGGGPADVVELTLELAKEMLRLAGIHDVDLAENLSNGRAMDVWQRFIRAQDGDPNAPLPEPRHSHTIYADQDGVLTSLDAYSCGLASWRLGAGRTQVSDDIDHAAGINLHATLGDTVVKNQPLMTLVTNDDSKIAPALEALQNAYSIEEDATIAIGTSRIIESMTTKG